MTQDQQNKLVVRNFDFVVTKQKIGQKLLIKKINNAISDNRNLRKYHVEINSLRYPRNSLLPNYEKNDFIEHYKNLKLFFKENRSANLY